MNFKLAVLTVVLLFHDSFLVLSNHHCSNIRETLNVAARQHREIREVSDILQIIDPLNGMLSNAKYPKGKSVRETGVSSSSVRWCVMNTLIQFFH